MKAGKSCARMSRAECTAIIQRAVGVLGAAKELGIMRAEAWKGTAPRRSRKGRVA